MSEFLKALKTSHTTHHMLFFHLKGIVTEHLVCQIRVWESKQTHFPSCQTIPSKEKAFNLLNNLHIARYKQHKHARAIHFLDTKLADVCMLLPCRQTYTSHLTAADQLPMFIHTHAVIMNDTGLGHSSGLVHHWIHNINLSYIFVKMIPNHNTNLTFQN